MAGILYLSRLLIYQTERGSNPEIKDLLELMSKRLYRYITMPAMGVAWIAGFGILWVMPGFAKGGWFHVKFVLILALTASTIYAGRLVKGHAAGTRTLPSSKPLRWLNEVPTLLMLIIVGMAVFKPFFRYQGSPLLTLQASIPELCGRQSERADAPHPGYHHALMAHAYPLTAGRYRPVCLSRGKEAATIRARAERSSLRC